MKKEYAVHYALRSAEGATIHKAVIVKKLEEVAKTKRRIKEVGYGFLGVEWRERQKYRIPDNVGWQKF